MNLRVLYEDNHLISVFKPSRMLVQDDVTGDASLYDQVKYYLKNKYHKPGNVFLGLLHRLDRPVCGTILFARTSKAAARLSEQFRNHSIKKIYHTFVFGHPAKKADTLVHFLTKDHELNITSAQLEDVEGSLRAELSYEVVETFANTSLLKITLKTGRPHQIRSQLSAIGHPIMGDMKYGAPDLLPDQNGIALMATELTFKHPTKEEKITVTADLPANWFEYARNS